MNIKIIFYKSSSKYYDSICVKCDSFKNFSQQQSMNVLELTIPEIRQRYSEIKYIFETFKHWTKTEYFIDEKKVTPSTIDHIFSIISCENECSSCVLASEHCYEGTGWGCKYLDTIALGRNPYYSYRPSTYWYEFGYFENDIWKIDKTKIKCLLQKEIDEKCIKICQYFSSERFEKTLASLSDEIAVTEDGEWEYKYRNAPRGMQQSEIIGIKPKEEHSGNFGTTFSISLFGNKQEEKDEENESPVKHVPSTTFNDIGGIDKIVQQVREVIELPLIAPTLFEHYHIKPHKGILLYGPPSCGKTLIAKAIANEIQAHFISVNGPEILNKFMGQSESNLRNIFEEAKKMVPTIIYFDEFDAISSTRDSESNPLMASVVNQLLTLMDGIEETHRICAIASTNRIDMIDEAIKRPGRFDYVIEIQRPTPEGCKAIFKIHTQNMPIEEKFDKDSFVDEWLIGCSGAEIAFVASEAAYNSIRRTININDIFSFNQEIPITDKNIIIEEDFVKAAQDLLASRKRAETAKWRYQLS